MKKKILFLSLILALALIAVATIQGCGKAGDTGSGTPAASSSEEPEFTLSGEAI